MKLYYCFLPLDWPKKLGCIAIYVAQKYFNNIKHHSIFLRFLYIYIHTHIYVYIWIHGPHVALIGSEMPLSFQLLHYNNYNNPFYLYSLELFKKPVASVTAGLFWFCVEDSGSGKMKVNTKVSCMIINTRINKHTGLSVCANGAKLINWRCTCA